jgi:four helix bundle protein
VKTSGPTGLEEHYVEGSAFEVLTLTEIFMRRGLFEKQEATEIRKKAEVIDRKLHGLINSLRKRSKN